jgi:hypothetical protein
MDDTIFFHGQEEGELGKWLQEISALIKSLNPEWSDANYFYAQADEESITWANGIQVDVVFTEELEPDNLATAVKTLVKMGFTGYVQEVEEEGSTFFAVYLQPPEQTPGLPIPIRFGSDQEAEHYVSKYITHANSISSDEFYAILCKIVNEMDAEKLLAVPGIHEILQEHFNNEVIAAWQEENV